MKPQLVRDFLWCIESNELINLTSSFYHHFGDSKFYSMLLQLSESNPKHVESTLSEVLNRLKTRRLGDRFEAFWKAAFLLHPHFDIIYSNYPIRNEKNTLGELDFLVKYLPEDFLYHIEVTCKFYLEVPDVTSMASWMGPGLVDRLDKKLKRLENHQLTFLHNVEGRDILKKQGWEVSQSLSVFKGKFFGALKNSNPYLKTPVVSSNIVGFWGDREEIWERYSKDDYQWQVLDKPAWFAKQYDFEQYDSNKYDSKKYGSAGYVLDELLEGKVEFPKKIIALNEEGEVVRGFWVEDNWLSKAQKALPLKKMPMNKD